MQHRPFASQERRGESAKIRGPKTRPRHKATNRSEMVDLQALVGASAARDDRRPKTAQIGPPSVF